MGGVSLPTRDIFDLVRDELMALRAERDQDKAYDILSSDIRALYPTISKPLMTREGQWWVRAPDFSPRVTDSVLDPQNAYAQSSVLMVLEGPERGFDIFTYPIVVKGRTVTCGVNAGGVVNESETLENISFTEVEQARRWIVRTFAPFLDRSLSFEPPERGPRRGKTLDT